MALTKIPAHLSSTPSISDSGSSTAITIDSSGNVSLAGNLSVTGSTTTADNLVSADKNITLNYHASNDTSGSADGAGITIQDAVDASNNASLTWNASGDKFVFSHLLNAPRFIQTSSAESSFYSGTFSRSGSGTSADVYGGNGTLALGYDASNTRLVIADNPYFTGGNVGIGRTPSTGNLLDVAGRGYFGSVGTGEGNTKANMETNAVLKLKPHDGNSTNMTFAQVNSGAGMGIQVSNSPQTANWDIALNPYGGNVGIGTVDPSSLLTIKNDGSGGTWPMRIFNSQDSDMLAGFYESSSGDGYNGMLYINDGGGTTKVKLSTNGSSYFTGGILAVGGNSPSTGLSNSAASIQIIGNPTATADYSATSFNAGSLLSLDSNNDQNHYASIRFSHNGNTEGFFGLVRATATSDITDWVWQMYNGTANAYQEQFRISEVGYPQFPRMGAGSGENAVQWWSAGGRGGGMLIYVSSSQQYKKDITDCTIDSSKIYNLQAKSFKWNEKSVHEDKEDWGMIAEEVIEHIPELGIYRDGKVDSLQYEKLSVLLLEEIKKLNERIKVLEG